jgi:hypothetical protein
MQAQHAEITPAVTSTRIHAMNRVFNANGKANTSVWIASAGAVVNDPASDNAAVRNNG